MPVEVMIISVVGIVAVFGFATTILRELIRSRNARAPLPVPAMAEVSRQLAELQQTMDATAIEVERLGEGLRFTTKLLAERTKVAEPARQPEKVITPH